MGSRNSGGNEPASYTRQVAAHLESDGWELDRTHVSGDVYLLGGTNNDGRSCVVVVAAGTAGTLSKDHIALAKQAAEKYDADLSMVHARGGISAEAESLAGEHGIRPLRVPTLETTGAAEETGPTSEAEVPPTAGDTPDANQTATDDGSRTRRAVLALGLIAGGSAGGWYLLGGSSSDSSPGPTGPESPEQADGSTGSGTAETETGSTEEEGGGTDTTTANPEIQWQYVIDDPSGPSNTPTVADGTVYVGSNNHFLYALDADTGALQWRFETGDLVSSKSTVRNGTVYFGSWDSFVYAVDAETGTERWSVRTEDGVEVQPIVGDGTVYAGTRSHREENVHAFDAATGERLWTHKSGDRIRARPAYADGTLFVGDKNNTVLALDGETGKQKWRFERPQTYQASPTVSDGTVFVGSSDGTVSALDAASGEQQWVFEPGKGVKSPPRVTEGILFVGLRDGSVVALDPTTGERIWTTETKGRLSGSPVVHGGSVYVQSWSARIVSALNASAGTEEWTLELDGVTDEPAVADGLLYASTEKYNRSSTNRLVAISIP